MGLIFKMHFPSNFKTLRKEFEAEAQRSGKPRLLLSAATAAGKSKIDSAYDIPAMVKYVF